MLKRIASLLIGFSAVSQPVDAQSDQTAANDGRWVIYDRVAPDGKPLVIVARTGNAQVRTLLLTGRATVVICRTDPANINDQGMPQGTDRLYPLEDKLDHELPGAGAIRVASVTGQGQRRMFFLHRDPLDLSPMLQTARVRGFSCISSEVDDRQVLISLVTPTPIEIQLNGDQEVIANLQKAGDSGFAPRKTDFWFYGEKGSLNGLAANLKTRGFLIDHWLSDPTGVVLSRSMSVVMAAFQALTPALVAAAQQSGVDYDGWETIVVTSDHHSPK